MNLNFIMYYQKMKYNSCYIKLYNLYNLICLDGDW